jgi:hypothetical protein
MERAILTEGPWAPQEHRYTGASGVGGVLAGFPTTPTRGLQSLQPLPGTSRVGPQPASLTTWARKKGKDYQQLCPGLCVPTAATQGQDHPYACVSMHTSSRQGAGSSNIQKVTMQERH